MIEPAVQAPLVLLASASVRRRKILSELGVRFRIVSPPEIEDSDGDPEEMVQLNANRKLDWCARGNPGWRILAADTVVVFNGRPLGKPGDTAQAARWLMEFSGRRQEVMTGVAYLDGRRGLRERVVRSAVLFRKFGEHTVADYLSRVDPLDKAGGYDIDQCGDLIIESYEGSRTNIMGLPSELVGDWFREDGVL